MSRIAAILSMIFLLSGCGAPSDTFRRPTEGYDPAEVSDRQWEAIDEPLVRLFGTPDEPLVPDEVELDLAKLQTAAGPPRWNTSGEEAGLYRRHCASCHGISGDGAGAAALLLNPYPRDFRPGLFKYHRSISGWAKPTDEDLDRTIREGNIGTGMPAFPDLTDAQRESLVEYVKYLTIRGETERFLAETAIDQKMLPVDRYELEDTIAFAWEDWNDATSPSQSSDPTVPEDLQPDADGRIDLSSLDEESIRRGFEFYKDENARCVECHGPEGRGDGEQTDLYDEWNKPKRRATEEATRAREALYRLPIIQARPRDFAEGAPRGGSLPVELYHRIHVGIGGTVMPAAGPTAGSTGVLTESQIWDVVRYVLSHSR